MHREIRHNLEDYLKGERLLEGMAPELPAEFHSHLEHCEECATELKQLERQSQLLRSLRSPGEIEPRAGFYARVLERIEAQPASIWSVFLDRKFGLRLAIASAALVALLGTYLVTSEPSGPEFAHSPAVVFTDPPLAQVSLPEQGSELHQSTMPASDQDQPDAAQANQTQADRQEGVRQQQQRDAVLVDLASYRP